MLRFGSGEFDAVEANSIGVRLRYQPWTEPVARYSRPLLALSYQRRGSS